MASGSGAGSKRGGKGTTLRNRTAASARRMQSIMQAGAGAPF